MREAFPLAVAWQALRRSPYIFLIPVAWDLFKWLLGLGLAPAGLYFARWDFAIGIEHAGAGWLARFTLPPAMPSVAQVGVALSPPPPDSLTLVHLGVMLGILLLDCLVRAGFLNLLNGLLHDVPPSAAGMWRGARRFGWRLFTIALIWMAYHSGISTLAASGRFPGFLVIPLSVFVIVMLAVAEFITVADDALPPIAVLGAPVLLWGQLGWVLAIVALHGLATSLLTGVATLIGADWPVVLGPVYAVIGTLGSAGILQALQLGVSTRPERDSMAWVCPGCKVNNNPEAAMCVACGLATESQEPEIGTASPHDEEGSQGG